MLVKMHQILAQLIFLSLTVSASQRSTLSIDLERLCIDEILNAISNGTTCTEITNYFLNRTRKYNAQINAFITIDEAGSLERAQKLDQHYARRNKLLGKLHCVPILVKDNILVKGLPVTLGVSIFKNSTASEDALAVDKLRKAGAVILGKANMAPLAIGMPEEGYDGKAARNPHSLDHPACSSSNGNAAALAARLSVLGLTSDTSGSTTGPAMVTHIVGLRPPIENIDTAGLFPLMGPNFDTLGLMALKAKDICTMMEVLSLNQTYDCDIGTAEKPIRIGVVGNFTYGEFEGGFGPTDSDGGDYKTDLEVQYAFRRFHENLTRLANVSVHVNWDDDFGIALTNATGEDWFQSPAAYHCIVKRANQFLAKHEIITDLGERMNDLRNMTMGLWERKALSYCAIHGKANRCTDELVEQQEMRLRATRKLLEDTLFTKYDILVLTYNPHSLITGFSNPSLGIGFVPGYGRLFSHSESSRMPDVASFFAYPALALPIGFTKITLEKWESLPVSAYLLSTPEKFPLMLELARRYEDEFWAPKMPNDFKD